MGKSYVWKRAGLLCSFTVLLAALFALAAGGAMAAVDLNTADQKTLESLPGVGPSLAQVKGIKQGVYNKIKDRLTVQ